MTPDDGNSDIEVLVEGGAALLAALPLADLAGVDGRDRL